MFHMMQMMILFPLLAVTGFKIGKHKYLCSRFANCECEDTAEKVSVFCSIHKNFQIIPTVLKDMGYIPIRYMSLKNCSEISLQDNLFINSSIAAMMFMCPFKHLGNNSLSQIDSLSYLGMVYTKFAKIPSAVAKLHDLRTLKLMHGKLSHVGNELQGMKLLRYLNLGCNVIESIERNAFVSNVYLQSVFLGENRIRKFHPETFRYCQFIKHFHAERNELESVIGVPRNEGIQKILLRSNRLRTVGNVFNRHMDVEIIDIGNNMFLDHLSNNTFSSKLLHLKKLFINNCKLATLPPRLLKPLPYLEEIHLDLNRLINIPEKFFHNLMYLRIVDLRHNFLVSLNGAFMRNPVLENVNLRDNRMEDLSDVFRYTPSVNKINLRSNNIRELREDDFKYCYSLEVLVLTHNSVNRVDTKVFHGTKLSHLDLHGNRISHLNGSLRNIRTLKQIKLGGNSLKIIDEYQMQNLDNLVHLNLLGNRIKTVNGAFKNLRNLQFLNLRINKLQTLSKNAFPSTINVRELEASANKWVCDCRLLWLRDHYINKNFTDNGKPMYCNRPLRFQGRKLVDLSTEDLVRWVDGCPLSCRCTCDENGELFSVKVDCSSRNLTEVPSTLPELTGQLNMQNNSITKLFLEMENLPILRILDLEMNSLKELDFAVPQDVSTLKLANNNIERFFSSPPPGVTSWTLSNNPWICDCKTEDFRNWILLHHNKVSDVNETKCSADNFPEYLRNKVIKDLKEVDLCPIRISTYIIASVSFLIVLLAGTISLLVYSRYRYHIKVWLFSKGLAWLKKEEECDRGKTYDAFISSAEEDLYLVKDYILPELEDKEPFYVIFEPWRNMIAGLSELGKQMEEVTKSKRVIILLSENYIRNNFLMEIFKTAFATSLEEKLFRLILIVVGDLPPPSELDPCLKAAVESTRCLRFGQKLFWEMLRYAMPKTAQTCVDWNVWEDNAEDVPLLQ